MSTTPDAFLHETYAKLHAMPEIAYEEKKTAAFLANQLEALGYQVVRNIGTTGVLGMLDSGKPGPHFALRGDMDALRFEVNGAVRDIHACGHDANCAMVLTAARRAAQRGIGAGRLYILFQQAEERVGSPEMIKTGKLNDIEELVGIHLRPVQEAVLGQATPALSHSATNFAFFEVHGKPSHSARPHLGVNAIDVAASIVAAINAIHENPSVAHSIKVTQIESIGNTINTIPDRVRMTVDMRAQTNAVADSLIEKLETILNGTAALYGASIANLTYEGTPAGEYDQELISLAEQAIRGVLEDVLPTIYTTGGDDFQYYKKMLGVKTTYIGVGADVAHGLHHPDMHFNSAAMDHGADILERLIGLRLTYAT